MKSRARGSLGSKNAVNLRLVLGPGLLKAVNYPREHFIIKILGDWTLTREGRTWRIGE